MDRPLPSYSACTIVIVIYDNRQLHASSFSFSFSFFFKEPSEAFLGSTPPLPPPPAAHQVINITNYKTTSSLLSPSERASERVCVSICTAP